jgi:phosphoglycolate phosphatase
MSSLKRNTQYTIHNTNEIKLIIFDLDGTLIDAYPAITKSFNYTMRKMGYPLQSRVVIRRAVGWGDENLLRLFVRPEDLKKALLIYRNHHRRSLIQASRLMAGVKILLARLKNKGYKLAVASNRPTKFSLILLSHLNLKKYFSYVLCADRLKHGKPHPEILNRIMERFSLKPKQTLYVGDMVIDAQAGRRAKVKTIIVPTGSSTLTEIKKERPFRIIPKVRDLLKCPIFSTHSATPQLWGRFHCQH